VQPAEAVGQLVKQYNAWYLLDACQSLGQLPVSAQETRADFISGTFRKFLRGPRGAGLMYVSDEVLEAGLEIMLPDIRGAEWDTPGTYEVRSDAKRFEDWETSYALKAGSTAALAYFLDIGIAPILEWNRTLSNALRKGLDEIAGVEVRDRGTQLCNIITFTIAGVEKEQALQFFHKRHINIYATSQSSARLDFAEKGVAWVLRASPHYYNTLEEIGTFLEAVSDLSNQVNPGR
jgi:selenocysteine lyase/cysteine desulfurase